MDDYSDAPVDDLVRAIRIALEWIEELVEEGDDGRRADEVVDLVRHELHPQLGHLVHDLELHLVVVRELLDRLLKGQQLLGADVLLVVRQRARHFHLVGAATLS